MPCVLIVSFYSAVGSSAGGKAQKEEQRVTDPSSKDVFHTPSMDLTTRLLSSMPSLEPGPDEVRLVSEEFDSKCRASLMRGAMLKSFKLDNTYVTASQEFGLVWRGDLVPVSPVQSRSTSQQTMYARAICWGSVLSFQTFVSSIPVKPFPEIDSAARKAIAGLPTLPATNPDFKHEVRVTGGHLYEVACQTKVERSKGVDHLVKQASLLTRSAIFGIIWRADYIRPRDVADAADDVVIRAVCWGEDASTSILLAVQTPVDPILPLL